MKKVKEANTTTELAIRKRALFFLYKGDHTNYKEKFVIFTLSVVTKKQLVETCRRIGDNKALGLDTVYNTKYLSGLSADLRQVW